MVGHVRPWLGGWVILAGGLAIAVCMAPENTKLESLATNLLASVLIAPVVVFFLENRIEQHSREREQARLQPRDDRIRSGLRAEIAFVLNRIFVVNPSLLGELELPWLDDGDVVEFLTVDWPAKRSKVAEGIRAAPWPVLQMATAGVDERQERLLHLAVLGFDPFPAHVHRHLMDAIDFARTAVDRERAGRFVLDRDTRDKEALGKVFAKHVADQLEPLVAALIDAYRGLGEPDQSGARSTLTSAGR